MAPPSPTSVLAPYRRHAIGADLAVGRTVGEVQGLIDEHIPDTTTTLQAELAAAQRATELGVQAYNILEGFEGDPDDQAHRGTQGGWRVRGLPWQQN